MSLTIYLKSDQESHKKKKNIINLMFQQNKINMICSIHFFDISPIDVF